MKKILTIILAMSMIWAFTSCGESKDINNSTDSTTNAGYTTEFTDESDYDEVAYYNLAKNPETYKGYKVKLKGEVIQVTEDSELVTLRVALSYGMGDVDYDDVVLVCYEPDIIDERIIEGEYVVFYGISAGVYTYESTMGTSVTVPLIYAQKI